MSTLTHRKEWNYSPNNLQSNRILRQRVMEKQRRSACTTKTLQYLMHGRYPEGSSKQDKGVIRKRSKHYRARDGQLYRVCTSKNKQEERLCLVIYGVTGGSDTIRVEFSPIQQQAGSTDCGIFAIAFATDLAFGKPVKISYQQCAMREHFAKCLQNEKMEKFSRSKRSAHTSI